MGFIEKYSIVENNDTTFWDALTKLLEQYKSKEWIAYKIFSLKIACGMVNYTTVFLVDKHVEVAEEIS